MITPREARLVRVATLQTFRDAVITLACAGAPVAARNRLVVVPTRAAAAHLLRAIEDTRVGTGQAAMLPEFVTRAELVQALADRLSPGDVPLTELRFRCSNCGSDRTDSVVTSRDNPQPW